MAAHSVALCVGFSRLHLSTVIDILSDEVKIAQKISKSLGNSLKLLGKFTQNCSENSLKIALPASFNKMAQKINRLAPKIANCPMRCGLLTSHGFAVLLLPANWQLMTIHAVVGAPAEYFSFPIFRLISSNDDQFTYTKLLRTRNSNKIALFLLRFHFTRFTSIRFTFTVRRFGNFFVQFLSLRKMASSLGFFRSQQIHIEFTIFQFSLFDFTCGL